jgi:hypothetical protein
MLDDHHERSEKCRPRTYRITAFDVTAFVFPRVRLWVDLRAPGGAAIN